MTILKEMESLEQEHDQYMQDLKSGGTVRSTLTLSSLYAILLTSVHRSNAGGPRQTWKRTC